MTVAAKLLLGYLVLLASSSQKAEKPEDLLFPPSTFTRAPLHVRQQLQAMHCRIFKKENLIKGNFAAEKQVDWATLCVNGDKIQPVVLWGGKTQCDSHPAPARDYKEITANPLRDAYIAPAGAKKIGAYHDAFGGPDKVPAITHAGLEVGDEQASIIYFCQQGKWIELTGAD